MKNFTRIVAATAAILAGGTLLPTLAHADWGMAEAPAYYGKTPGGYAGGPGKQGCWVPTSASDFGFWKACPGPTGAMHHHHHKHMK